MRLAIEPALQQMGCCDSILGCATTESLRERRREAFIRHLDRHGTILAYAEAKMNIIRNQTPQDYAVLNADDPMLSGWESQTA